MLQTDAAESQYDDAACADDEDWDVTSSHDRSDEADAADLSTTAVCASGMTHEAPFVVFLRVGHSCIPHLPSGFARGIVSAERHRCHRRFDVVVRPRLHLLSPCRCG